MRLLVSAAMTAWILAQPAHAQSPAPPRMTCGQILVTYDKPANKVDVDGWGGRASLLAAFSEKGFAAVGATQNGGARLANFDRASMTLSVIDFPPTAKELAELQAKHGPAQRAAVARKYRDKLTAPPLILSCIDH